MPFVVGVLGIAFWLRMAKILEPALGRSKWVNLIADNTYTIMINQILGFMVAKTVFAVMNKYMGIFSGFDWGLYKADYGYLYGIWYYGSYINSDDCQMEFCED